MSDGNFFTNALPYESTYDAPSGTSGPAKEDEPMEIDWLTSKQPWPESAARVVARYMAENNFYNYSKKSDNSKHHLRALVAEVRSLFKGDEWVEADHNPLLKRKVLNKMHKIREEKNPLASFRRVLNRLRPEHHPAAMELVQETTGLSQARDVSGTP